MNRQAFIYSFIVSLLTSFLIWALVAAMAGRKPRLLEQISRVARIVTWVLYAGMFACILFAMGDSIDRKIPAYVGTVGVPFWLGIDLMRDWIRRRVKPEVEPKASEDGWWPTPKDS